MTDDERRSIRQKLPWSFSSKRRRMRKRDLERGEIEVLTFTAERVWASMMCGGAPCCPNDWFIDAGGGEFVSIRSWDWLGVDLDLQFPGRRVTIERLPESHWLASGRASGEPVPVLPLLDLLKVETPTIYRASDA